MSFLNNFFIFFNKKNKISLAIIIFLSLLQILLELIGIASIIPFVTFLLEPEKIKSLPYFSSYIKIDNFDLNNNLILIFCLVFFLIFLFKNILIILTNKNIFNFIFSMRSQIYEDLLKKILSQKYFFFIKQRDSRIFNVTFQETSNFSANVIRPVINIITELIVSISIFTLLIFLGYSQTLLIILPIFFICGLILKKINKLIKKWSLTRIQDQEKLTALNFNLVNGIKETFLYGKEKNIIKNFIPPLWSLSNLNSKNSLIVTYPKVILEQAVILILILIILIMLNVAKTNSEIIVTISIYMISAYRLLPSVNKIFVSYQQLKFGKPSISILLKYYNLSNQRNITFKKENSSSVITYSFNKKISLENISFAYTEGSKNILSNTNFHFNKNETVGIYGESGSGKSTLVNILIGLLNLNSGRIIIDDKILDTSKNISNYQKLFSLTAQDSFLINGTIKDNIIFGSNSDIIDEVRVSQAIIFANLNEMIKKLPNGIDTDIGSSIKKISSGQKQRIAIARSFYLNKKIMIFDEATNALDEENELQIMQNIKGLKNNKTLIIISHNKNNIKDCDRIYQFDPPDIKTIK